MSNVERAVSAFREGFSCSQAVFSAYAPGLGLDRETALRISTGFGAGIARMGKTCGAVSGAIMVIGLKHGRSRADDSEARDRTYALADEFARRFESRNGSLACRELLGCDIGTEEGMGRAVKEGLFEDLCPELVRSAAEILEEIL